MTIVPEREVLCSNGHSMVGRSLPIAHYEQISTMGCVNKTCPMSIEHVIREMLELILAKERGLFNT